MAFNNNNAFPIPEWKASETREALHLKMELPFLENEDVKVCVDPDKKSLVIKCESACSSQEEVEAFERGVKCSVFRWNPEKGTFTTHLRGRFVITTIPLTLRARDVHFNTDEMQSEMKNGVLNVVVPKLEVQRNGADVIQVNID